MCYLHLRGSFNSRIWRRLDALHRDVRFPQFGSRTGCCHLPAAAQDSVNVLQDYPEDCGSTLGQNTGTCLPVGTASCSGRRESSSVPLWAFRLLEIMWIRKACMVSVSLRNDRCNIVSPDSGIRRQCLPGPGRIAQLRKPNYEIFRTSYMQ